MAKKIDLSGAKNYLFNHGEKIALGVCAALILIFGVIGMWRAFGASRTDGGEHWAKAFEKNRLRLENGISTAPSDPKIDDGFLNSGRYVWNPVTSTYDFTPMGLIAEKEDKGRRNPFALTIKDDIQIKYLPGLTFRYEVDTNERRVTGLVDPAAKEQAPPAKGAADPVPPLMNVGAPLRMVVVTAVFPMRQQVEEFRRALKLPDQKDLFSVDGREDLPRFYGIDVVRFEIGRDGMPVQGVEPVIIVARDAEGKLKINPALEKVLREAVYDEYTPTLFAPYLYEGLAMPMPRLGNTRYPRFTFKDIDIDWAEEMMEKKNVTGGNPMDKTTTGGIFKKVPPKKGVNPAPDPMAGAATLKPKPVPEKDLKADKDYVSLADRLFGRDFNIYHVLGEFAKEQPAPAAPVVPVVGKPAMKKQAKTGEYFHAWDIEAPKQDNAKAFVPWERDALVRFIDVDVEPGKTYKYGIQVRIANPNFGKKDKVAWANLADIPELSTAPGVFPVIFTPSVTIPRESYLYAVDQVLVDELGLAAPAKKGNVIVGDATVKQIKEFIPFQVHQWVGKKADNVGLEHAIGDWAILERQLVRRGEHIGLAGFVTVPVWSPLKEAFDVPKFRDIKAKPPIDKHGIHIDLLREPEAPVLVDFVGGKRIRLGTSNIFEEDTAVEALILGPDGKLRVLNSRDAADGNNPTAIDRESRVMSARQRATEAQRSSAPVMKKGPPG